MVKLPSGKYFNVDCVAHANWHRDKVTFAISLLGEDKERLFCYEDGLFLERVLHGRIDFYLQSIGEDTEYSIT